MKKNKHYLSILILTMALLISASGFTYYHVHSRPFHNNNYQNDYPSLVILLPKEREIFDLYPRNTTVVWTSVPGATSYKLIVQLSGAPYDFSATDFYSMPYSDKGIYQTIKTFFTYKGMGAQVHRFKVEAKKGNETIAVTPWRYIKYIR